MSKNKKCQNQNLNEKRIAEYSEFSVPNLSYICRVLNLIIFFARTRRCTIPYSEVAVFWKVSAMESFFK